MYLVPFISKRWEQLAHCEGTDDRLRLELENLFDPRDRTAAGDDRRTKALEVVNNFVFHQQSTYPSTYVTVPYLVQNLERFDHRLQHSIIDMVTGISTQGQPHGDLRDAELAAYDQSLSLLEQKSETLLRHDAELADWCDSWPALNLLGRLATLRGLGTIGSHLRHGEEETNFACQHCGAALQSRGPAAPYENQTIELKEVLLSCSEPFEKQFLLPLARNVVCQDDLELTSGVYPRNQFVKLEIDISTAGARGGQQAAAVHQWSSNLGHYKIAKWLSNFYGFCHCPRCGFKHDLAQTLTAKQT